MAANMNQEVTGEVVIYEQNPENKVEFTWNLSWSHVCRVGFSTIFFKKWTRNFHSPTRSAISGTPKKAKTGSFNK